MNEFEKMVAGKLYDSVDPTCLEKRVKAHRLFQEFNALIEGDPKRKQILRELFPDAGEGFYLTGPIYVDYGINTHFGKHCYANFSLYILDTCPIYIGDDVAFGCSVHLMTPVHPLIGEERKGFVSEKGYFTDVEYGKPITIGSRCWIASNVTIIGGVTIGEDTVIGAGSVVTRDIPPGVFAAGNPCRVIRKITPEDSVYLKGELQ